MRTKKIFSLFLAKDLCKLGYKIVGIEYNKPQDKEVYVFEVSEGFWDDLTKLDKQFKKKK